MIKLGDIKLRSKMKYFLDPKLFYCPKCGRVIADMDDDIKTGCISGGHESTYFQEVKLIGTYNTPIESSKL